jgi:hypothetical protein
VKRHILTKQVFEDFDVALQVGAKRATAAQYADVPMAVVREWLELGKTQPKPGLKPSKRRERFNAFRRMLLRGRSAFEVRVLGKLVTAKDWRGAKAALDRIERQSPKRPRTPAAESDTQRAELEAWAREQGANPHRLSRMTTEMLTALYAAAHDEPSQLEAPNP